jgi:hypothetical protein
MGVTTIGKSVLAAALAGSYTSNHFIGVGIGSTAYASGNTALVSEFERNQVDTIDLSTAGQVTFIANWSPNDISGCVLTEHGLFTLGSALITRNVLTGSLVFDGEQELQIQKTVRFLISG